MKIRLMRNCRYYGTNRGFTLLEVMIAVSIFGLLILYVSQLMNMEIRLFNSVSKQNDLAHNSRVAMMHILDEIRLNPNTEKEEYKDATPPSVRRYYYSGDPEQEGRKYNEGVYYYYVDEDEPVCLINVNPQNPESLTKGPLIFFSNSELKYIDVRGNTKIITDQIQSINLSTEADFESLLKIEITATDNSKLISWIRLY